MERPLLEELSQYAVIFEADKRIVIPYVKDGWELHKRWEVYRLVKKWDVGVSTFSIFVSSEQQIVRLGGYEICLSQLTNVQDILRCYTLYERDEICFYKGQYHFGDRFDELQRSGEDGNFMTHTNQCISLEYPDLADQTMEDRDYWRTLDHIEKEAKEIQLMEFPIIHMFENMEMDARKTKRKYYDMVYVYDLKYENAVMYFLTQPLPGDKYDEPDGTGFYKKDGMILGITRYGHITIKITIVHVSDEGVPSLDYSLAEKLPFNLAPCIKYKTGEKSYSGYVSKGTFYPQNCWSNGVVEVLPIRVNW
jgi:hypothetical protein